MGDWFLRWDLSPLGYLSTAGHGHCDALHLSIWHKGEPIVIDPGTGAYHSDRRLRDYLSSWEAHNGPHPPKAAVPERRGAFLWVNHHGQPRWEKLSDVSMRSELTLANGTMRRTITRLEVPDGWQIEDGFYSPAGSSSQETVVLWQLAPRARLEAFSETEFRIQIAQTQITVQLGSGWRTVQHGSPKEADTAQLPAPIGACSSAFRRVEAAPFLLLKGLAQEARVLRTTFLVGAGS